MKYTILILTDNNRRSLKFKLSLSESFNKHLSEWEVGTDHRIIYKESYDTFQDAQARISELETYTRMQVERLIRRSNPNWLNLLIRPSIQSPTRAVTHYHPGAKFNPKVPKRTSERWNGMA